MALGIGTTMQPSEPILLDQTLTQFLSPLQLNQLQSLVAQMAGRAGTESGRTEFALKLIDILQTGEMNATCEVALGVQQQLEQVTLQIRQSLELPVILQTAVEQGRQFLNTDRLIIYQVIEGENDRPERGFVAYEAKVDSVTSVLNLTDTCHMLQSSYHPVLYCQGLALAVEDITEAYRATPCLLEFLQKAQVQSKLIAPIFLSNCLWGVLVAHECHQTRRWHNSEQQFLQQIAEHLAIAISHAQLYAEVQQQKQTLEQRVIERTHELQEVMQAAQSANRAKSEFLASVTHELRTPLTCIIGMSTTLQRWSKDVLNERQHNFLQTIHDSGEHLLALINDILDVSQAEAAQMGLSLSQYSPALLARQTLKAFEGQAALQDLDLELELDIDPQDRYTADPRRLQQVLFNLIDNAIKFTPAAGKVMLRVFQAENHIVFQVQDTGIGIAADQMPLLFQKFQQLDTGYQRQYKGTGLGLALTKQLVELHGGWIDVESTVGVGSVFTVRLPSAPAVGVQVRMPPTIEPRGRIMLLEQDEETADIICDVLTAAGYQIVWILDGSSAIDQIGALRPLVVITNTQLSDMEGDRLIHCFRQNPTVKSVKIIALVESSDVRSMDDWIALGADEALTQPIRPDLLVQKILSLTVG